jgi:hypothetical protein
VTDLEMLAETVAPQLAQLRRRARAFVHRWFEDDPAATDAGLKAATEEIERLLVDAFVAGHTASTSTGR